MQNLDLSILLVSAIIFGISNGLSPGPTLALVISHTIHHDYRAGIKVACSPLLFGIIIVPISVFTSLQLDAYNKALGLISILGATFIAYLGVKQLLLKKIKLDKSVNELKSFRYGAFANFASPYAYIFWLTVGGPLIIRTKVSSLPAAVSFVIIYYFCLVGSKILLALIIEKFRFSIERGYSYIMHLLSVTLFIFAYFIFKEGILLLTQ